MSTNVLKIDPVIGPPGAEADNQTPSITAAQPAPGLPPMVIRPPRGWQFINVRELWASRELLGFLVWRDVKVRYKQTLLGAAWAILQPMLMMAVFTVFFSHVAKLPAGKLPYPIFVFAGLLPWTFFATSIANAGNSVVGAERLITKIYFPRLAVPFAAIGAALVDFAIAMGMLIIMMFWYHVPPTLSMLFVPVVVMLIMLEALGVGTLLAALNVAYRDFRYVIPFLTQLWMFATPTVYMQPTHETGARAFGIARYLLLINPMTGLIGAFRAAVFGERIGWHEFASSTLAAIIMFIVGCMYFRRVEDDFADLV
jgi:lipopolysaccharide transport system permease protein